MIRDLGFWEYWAGDYEDNLLMNKGINLVSVIEFIGCRLS